MRLVRDETSNLVSTITLARPELLNRFYAAPEREFDDALSIVRRRPRHTRPVVLLAEFRPSLPVATSTSC